jgi:flagellar protein FlaG
MSSSSSLGGVLSQPPPAIKPLQPVEHAAKSDALTVTNVDSLEPQTQLAHAANTPGKPWGVGHLSQMVEELQKKVATYSSELKFSIDQNTGKSIVKLTDTSTNTLIWQYPSEQVMQIAKEIDKFQQGLVINYKA